MDDFKELVSKRCMVALMENKSYTEKENSGIVTQDELNIIAEGLCYRKGFSDALKLTLYSQNV